MDGHLTAFLSAMFGSGDGASGSGRAIFDPSPWLVAEVDPVAGTTAAFLVAAAGAAHPDHAVALAILGAPGASGGAGAGPAATLAAFYRDGLERMTTEFHRVTAADPDVAARFAAAVGVGAASPDAAREAIWGALFPQAVGILGHEEVRVRDLRAARTVTVVRPVPDPITDPAREILFTSNVLLTIPSATTDVGALPYPQPLRDASRAATGEPQRYWYDHPIQLGVEPAGNELLYGLRELDAAIDAEPGVGVGPEAGRVACLLSVSVTHHGLGAVARPYVEAELARAGGLRNLDVVVVTEDDARRLVDEVIVPTLALGRGADAAGVVAAAAAADGLRAIFGVDGEYGRHYSFLKAIAALWHVTIDPAVRATFKIDLDQVFPQDALVAETGRTAFGHLGTPLWGALARDSEGRDIELGMVAGALVNERDIGRNLFTPDVDLPAREPVLDEHVFFSALPQAISTRAEMMERYDGPDIDGVGRALERIHVTGGTNGIRVDALRRHRPFTPTFVGRAEDQAYILSTLGRPGPRLAYAHAAGLIMRHDKDAFAGEAIAAAHVGKLIGDDVRILVFSAYADAVAGSDGGDVAGGDGGGDGGDGGVDGGDGSGGSLDRAAIGRLLDPFTGGFASALPETVVLLRMALRTIRLFMAGEADQAREYAIDGARRVEAAFHAIGDVRAVAARVAGERAAWDAYYDALDLLEAGIAAGDERALGLRTRAIEIIDDCRVRPASSAGEVGHT